MSINYKRVPMAIALLLVVSCGEVSNQGGSADQPLQTSSTNESAATSQPTTTHATTTSTAAERTTTAESSISAEPLESVIGGTASGPGWAVEPGTYEGRFDGRSVILEIEEPITLLEGEGRLDFTQLNPVQAGVPEWVMIGTFVGVIPAEEAGRHADHDQVVPEYTIDLPDDLGDHLATIEQLQVEEAGQIQVEGFTARAWDVAVDPSLGSTFSCFLGDCVSVLVSDYGGVYVFGDDAAARVWQLEGDGSGVYAYLQSDPENFEATVRLAEMLLENMRFADRR